MISFSRDLDFVNRDDLFSRVDEQCLQLIDCATFVNLSDVRKF